MAMVQFYAHNAKVVELTLLISSMDNLRLVLHVGFAEGRRICYAEIATELAFWVVS
ncbi:hypothetical protein LguiA_033040 [Lonicera macranthoides]